MGLGKSFARVTKPIFSFSFLVVAGYTVFVFSLGKYYYQFSNDWLKEAADLAWVVVQSLAVPIGAFWVVRTFGWERKIDDIIRVKSAIKSFIESFSHIIDEMVHPGGDMDGPFFDFEDFYPALWKAKEELVLTTRTSTIPSVIKKKIIEAANQSCQQTQEHVLMKNDMVIKVLSEALEDLNTIHPY